VLSQTLFNSCHRAMIIKYMTNLVLPNPAQTSAHHIGFDPVLPDRFSGYHRPVRHAIRVYQPVIFIFLLAWTCNEPAQGTSNPVGGDDKVCVKGLPICERKGMLGSVGA
jgi:hypothetical protein